MTLIPTVSPFQSGLDEFKRVSGDIKKDMNGRISSSQSTIDIKERVRCDLTYVGVDSPLRLLDHLSREGFATV